MKNKIISPILPMFVILGLALFLRFVIADYLKINSPFASWFSIIIILSFGAYIIQKIAKIIEETTHVLKNKTGLAGGLLQAFGTAFADMVLGVTAALMSLAAARKNQLLAVNYAIIAASTTFGSNIYNIGYATWSLFRQNLANLKNKEIKIIPFFGKSTAKPMKTHATKPYIIEMSTAIRIMVVLSVLTVSVALGMVLFGKTEAPLGITGDLYQLRKEVGLIILIISISVLYLFRKNYGSLAQDDDNLFTKYPSILIWVFLGISGAAIVLTAESMIQAVERIGELTSIPLVIAGTVVAAIACLPEVLVIHNFVVNPKGRIGDAVVGVAMDNIVTIMAASVIAVLGGIFLGGDSLIVIFVLILGINTLLIWQVSDLKDEYVEQKHLTAHLNKKP